MKQIFFIGIGGIGMSALAVYAKNQGCVVYGSDKDLQSKTIDLLKKNNILIFDEKNIDEIFLKNADIIVINNVILKDNQLYIIALKYNKIILYRSQFINMIMTNKKIIGITGSHGKTTTTGLIGHTFIVNKKNPTILVGGIMKNYKNNLIIGNSEYLIIEADDAYKSFLDLNPHISIITSISYEHLETYNNLNEIEKAFLLYAEKTSRDGIVIVNNDTDFLKEFIKKINHPNIISYGNNNDADYIIKNISCINNQTNFSLYYKNKFINNYKINLLGYHNISNAVATIITSINNNIDQKNIKKALTSFRGIERRFDYKGKYNHLKIYDDYAHHPVEINAVLSILKTKNMHAYIFFQPHKYIRLKHLWNDFITTFQKYKNNIQGLFITDVYAAGDTYDNEYNSYTLAEILKITIKETYYIPFDNEFKNCLIYKENLIKKKNKNIIILTLGAGLMNRFAEKLVKEKI
jgi:UDP-N-acetylmuramate--alanine ligase